MDIHIEGALRFNSETARKRALAAFDRGARAYLDRTLWTGADLILEAKVQTEVPADVDLWPELVRFAESAIDGALVYRTSIDPDVLVVSARTQGKLVRWERARYRPGDPSAAIHDQKLSDKRIALGLDPQPAPVAPQSFHVELLAAGERPLLVIKALRATREGLDLAGAKALLAELPLTLDQYVSSQRAQALAASFQEAGASVRVVPAG